MNKGLKIGLLVLVVAVIAIITYVFLKKNKADSSGGSTGSNSGNGNSIDTTPQSVTGSNGTVYINECSFPLSKGSKGEQVLFLQAYMSKYEGKDLTLDGIWGRNTDIAFEEVERFKGTMAPASGNYGEFSYEQYMAYVDSRISEIKNYVKTETGLEL
ncbi:MAG: hypothetical protein PHU97_08435 [Bacteroidales bacterium]|nr:hypothetical protein [Bacteroidales bacterium]MDD3011329.1 hypothetical protein [Bacteroidales bacterium]MDY0287062.1 hypothetical protein [Bacteroidales bacterium]HPG11698.1 hypothetical protein [Chitinophagaceae bacterium]